MLTSWTLALKLAYTLGPSNKPTATPTPTLTAAEHHVSIGTFELVPGNESFPYLAAWVAVAAIAMGIALILLQRLRDRPGLV